MMSFTITPAFKPRQHSRERIELRNRQSGATLGQTAKKWTVQVETEFIDLSAGLFPFSLPFWWLLPLSSVPWSSWTFDALLKFRHGIVGQRRARVKALDLS